MKAFFGPSGEAPLPATFVFDGDGRLKRAFFRRVSAAELSALLSSFDAEEIHVADLQLLGTQALVKQDFRTAHKLFTEWLALRPSAGRPHYLLAHALAGIGDDEGAIREFRASAQLDPSNLRSACFNAGTTLRKLGRPREAIEEYKSALGVLGEDTDMLLGAAGAAIEASKLDEALSYAERAIQAGPGSAACRTMHGKILLQMGKVVPARKSLEKALELDPDEEEARRLLRSFPK